MKVLVTGDTGFLGRHVVRRLAREHEVVGLSRGPEGVGVPHLAVDLLDAPAVEAAMEGVDAVVHAAGLVSYAPRDAELLHRVHVDGTRNVLAAAGDRPVVHVSSSGTVAVSTDPDVVADEDAPVPIGILERWPYYLAKLFSEQEALAAGAICLNPSLLLGPGDAGGTATRAVRLFLEDRLPAVPPGGLSFVDVRDVAEAISLALDRGRGGRRYLLGAANLSFTELYERLARITGRSPPAGHLPRLTLRVLDWFPGLGTGGLGFGARKVERAELEIGCHTWYVDSGRALRELGWRPRDPNETLRDTVVDLARGGS